MPTATQILGLALIAALAELLAVEGLHHVRRRGSPPPDHTAVLALASVAHQHMATVTAGTAAGGS